MTKLRDLQSCGVEHGGLDRLLARHQLGSLRRSYLTSPGPAFRSEAIAKSAPSFCVLVTCGFDFGDLLSRDLQAQHKQRGHAAFFDHHLRGGDSLTKIENILPIAS